MNHEVLKTSMRCNTNTSNSNMSPSPANIIIPPGRMSHRISDGPVGALVAGDGVHRAELSPCRGPLATGTTHRTAGAVVVNLV